MNMKRLCVIIVILFCQFQITNAQVTPEEALKKLEEGNKRYLSGELKSKNFTGQRAEQSKGQHPYAIILTCSDSRVPPELIFDEDLGELFVVRVAGNVIDEVTLGSIEYAAEHLHSQLLVILGHSSCGAVKATFEGGDFGKNINSLAARIKPAVDEAKTKTKDKTMALSLAIEENVNLQAGNCMADSRILEEMAHEGKFKIMCGFYNIETGKVNFVEHQHKAMAEPIEEMKEETPAPSKSEVVEKPHVNEKPKVEEKKAVETSKKPEAVLTGYNFGSDKSIKGTIFSDGKTVLCAGFFLEE